MSNVYCLDTQGMYLLSKCMHTSEYFSCINTVVYINTSRSCTYTKLRVFAQGKSQRVHSSVCVYFPSVYEKRKQTRNQISSKSRGEKKKKRWDCSWLWAWQQMCYTNPARCIQAVSMAMERVIVELRRAPPRPPPRWTRAPGPHRRCFAPSGQAPGPGEKKKSSRRRGGAPEMGSSWFIYFPHRSDGRMLGEPALFLGKMVSQDAK